MYHLIFHLSYLSMFAFKISFFENDNLPDNPNPYVIHFIKEGDYASATVTDHDGIQMPMGNVQMIQEVVRAMDIGSSSPSWTDVTVIRDENFIAANDTRYYIPPDLLTDNRSVDMSFITTRCCFIVEEDADRFYLKLSGVTCYTRGGSEVVDSVPGLFTSIFEKIGSKIIETQ